jgi:hypothetical protein
MIINDLIGIPGIVPLINFLIKPMEVDRLGTLTWMRDAGWCCF